MKKKKYRAGNKCLRNPHKILSFQIYDRALISINVVTIPCISRRFFTPQEYVIRRGTKLNGESKALE